MNEITNEEVFEEVNSILVDYTDLTKRFWRLYEQLDDETADLVTKAGTDKWLKYAFTLSMDELWFEAMSWELTPKDLETKVCGACGQFINAKEQDSEGNHKPKLCDANDEIKHEETHLALLEDFSNVIRKHLPTFDNNISTDTWKLLELFADETINQLTKETK